MYGRGIDELIALDRPIATGVLSNEACAFLLGAGLMPVPDVQQCLGSVHADPAQPVLEASCAPEEDHLTGTVLPHVTNSSLAPRSKCLTINPDLRAYFLQDEQRTVYGLAAFRHTEGHAVLVEAYEYTPYGTALVIQPEDVLGSVTFGASDNHLTAEHSTSAYLYTGRRHDAETGLMHYRTRYYDTEMGRFISKDTIGVWGDKANFGNAYAYTGSMPVQKTDPMGQQASAQPPPRRAPIVNMPSRDGGIHPQNDGFSIRTGYGSPGARSRIIWGHAETGPSAPTRDYGFNYYPSDETNQLLRAGRVSLLDFLTKREFHGQIYY